MSTTPTTVGPTSTQQVNRNLYVGQGYLLTIQNAVDFAALQANPQFRVVIPAGYAGTDTIASVVRGLASITIVDERSGPAASYQWNGAGYVATINLNGEITDNTYLNLQGFNFNIGGLPPTPTPGDGQSFDAEFLAITASIGQDTTGTTGQTGGDGALAALQGGHGGAAPAGSTNGNGGDLFLNGGYPGRGAGTEGIPGDVHIQDPGVGNLVQLGTTYIGGSTTENATVVQPGGDLSAPNLTVGEDVDIGGDLTAGDATFEDCLVANSPVRTFANTPDAGPGPTYPPAGIGVSTGTAWEEDSLDPLTAFVPQTLTQNVTVVNGGNTLAITGTAPTYIGGSSATNAVEIFNGGAISTPSNIAATGTTSVLVMGDQNAQIPDSTPEVPRVVMSVSGTAGTKAGGQFRFSTSNPTTDPTLQTLTLDHYTSATGDTLALLTATRQEILLNNIVSMRGQMGTTFTNPNAGLTVGWNLQSGFGETDFFNASGGGGGGYHWFNGAPGAVFTQSSTPAMILDSGNILTVNGPIMAGPASSPGVFVPANKSILAWNITGDGDTSFINGRGSGYGEFDWYIAGTGATVDNTTTPVMRLDSSSGLHLTAGPAVAATAYGITYVQPALASGQTAWLTTGLDIATGGHFAGLGYTNGATPHGSVGMIAGGLATFDFSGNWVFPASVSGPSFVVPGSGYMSGGGSNLILNPASNSGGTIMLNWNNSATGGTWFGNGASVPVASVNSTGVISGSAKNFVIPHPVDPSKRLTHSAIEGPEYAVFYRGEGETSGGIATIMLPDYFEALVRPEGRTIQLTERFEDDPDPTFGGFLAAGRVVDGKFTVRSSNPATKFYWEVKAVRADMEVLEVESEKLEGEGVIGPLSETRNKPQPQPKV